MRSSETTPAAAPTARALESAAQAAFPHLQVRDVEFHFGGGFHLGPVSLALQREEMTALLGPNGSGKSTLFRLIAGALKPSRGDVRLAGVPITSLSAGVLARRLAVVPQDVTVPPGYTVRDVVSFGRTAHAPMLASLNAADRRAITRALALTDMERLAERSFVTLSGGERQRGLLAMALAQEPELLLLDEPTSHLDVHYQVETLDLLRRLHASNGLTVLVTLHDLNLAALYFPRLILLHAGRIVADGNADAVIRLEVLNPVFQHRVRVLRHSSYPVPLVVPEPGSPKPF